VTHFASPAVPLDAPAEISADLL